MEDRKEIIIRLINERYTYEKIGKIFGISRQRVHQILKEYKPKKISKISILERDNYECQFCFGKNKLEIHHLDGNRKKNKKNNKLTLCRKCHGGLHRDLGKKKLST